MPDVHFRYHHSGGTAELVRDTGADQISWSYGLNVQRYPTYGGEVVQILSAYVDDLEITGTLRSYAEMEETYAFFLGYIQQATQQGGFDQSLMEFSYPERNWSMPIMPKELPGFRYSTDTVAPQWQLTAQIVQPDDDFKAYTVSAATNRGYGIDSTDFQQFGKLTAGIGYVADNPFSSPDANKYDPSKVADAMRKVGDWWAALIPAYTSGDPSKIANQIFGSGPASATPTAKSTTSAGSRNLSDKGGISRAQATAILKRHFPGAVIKAAEHEHESGQNIWSFDTLAHPGDNHVTEIWVDFHSGQIVKTSTETLHGAG